MGWWWTRPWSGEPVHGVVDPTGIEPVAKGL